MRWSPQAGSQPIPTSEDAMTVIACKDGVMAADTMLSAGNAQARAQKLVRLPDGGVAGARRAT